MSVLTATRPRLALGDRVRVKDSMLFEGRVGEIIPTSGHPDDPWDHYVTLEPQGLYGSQRIGVMSNEVDLIDDETEVPVAA